ncbi:MAG: hypothetical protein U1B80_08760 [Anaerolineaceae bacterium]|nr:hypothetical protein [Anaerolineaceae bacterium]
MPKHNPQYGFDLLQLIPAVDSALRWLTVSSPPSLLRREALP